jgi:hypothetical protein
MAAVGSLPVCSGWEHWCMKPFPILHAVVTLLLLITVFIFCVTALTGIVEVRFPAKGNISGEQIQGRANEPMAAKARLLVVRGAKPGMEYPIFEGANVIGRADQKPVEIDIEFQESKDRIWASRQHAVIICENGTLVIEDLNSSNGTYVNRNRVSPGTKQELKTNDIIQIGEVQLKVMP